MIKSDGSEVIEVIEDVEISAEEALDGVEGIDVAEPIRTGGVVQPIPIEVRENAFKLYMEHWTYPEICKELNIKKDTLGSWIKRYKWADQRNANDEEMLHDSLGPRKALISALAHKILTGCIKAVERDSKNGFSAKELPTYLSALSSIEKLSRLSRGLSTSISEERSKRANFTLPLEHLKNVSQVRIAQDPFTQQDRADAITVIPSGTSNDPSDP